MSERLRQKKADDSSALRFGINFFVFFFSFLKPIMDLSMCWSVMCLRAFIAQYSIFCVFIICIQVECIHIQPVQHVLSIFDRNVRFSFGPIYRCSLMFMFMFIVVLFGARVFFSNFQHCPIQNKNISIYFSCFCFVLFSI